MKYILHRDIDEFLPKNGNRGRIRIDCWEYSLLVVGTNSLIVTSSLLVVVTEQAMIYIIL
jgi:hypothetical protein